MLLEPRREKEVMQNMSGFHVFQNVWNSFKRRYEAHWII